MSKEPMFNIPERAPKLLIGFLFIVFTLLYIAPVAVQNIILSYTVLIPLDTQGASPFRQASSLLTHGLLHGGWSHLFVNCGMLLAFSVITLKGLRAHNHQTAERRYWMILCAGIIFGGICLWAWWAAIGTTQGAAVGISSGASALFATAAWAMGGRQRLIQFGMGWALLNLLLVITQPIMGIGVAWQSHMGGYIIGALLAPYWVKPFSSGFSIMR